jgi:hypothetical protein
MSLVLEKYQFENMLRCEDLAYFIYPFLNGKSKQYADDFLKINKAARCSNLTIQKHKTKTLEIFELITTGNNTIEALRKKGVNRATIRLNVKRGYLMHTNIRSKNNTYFLTTAGLEEFERMKSVIQRGLFV